MAHEPPHLMNPNVNLALLIVDEICRSNGVYLSKSAPKL